MRSTTVDSIPTVVGPPSRMTSTAAPSWATTCAAVVGETRVKALALGAAMGTPARSMRARATGCAGTRTPTVSSPALTASEISLARGRTRVSGPGQKAAARVRASAGTSRATRPTCDTSATWTMSGLNAGRPLAA